MRWIRVVFTPPVGYESTSPVSVTPCNLGLNSEIITAHLSSMPATIFSVDRVDCHHDEEELDEVVGGYHIHQVFVSTRSAPSRNLEKG